MMSIYDRVDITCLVTTNLHFQTNQNFGILRSDSLNFNCVFEIGILHLDFKRCVLDVSLLVCYLIPNWMCMWKKELYFKIKVY